MMDWKLQGRTPEQREKEDNQRPLTESNTFIVDNNNRKKRYQDLEPNKNNTVNEKLNSKNTTINNIWIGD